jgi:hypothetical protein
LKRDRDESDDQDSECSDEENDENKDSWVPSKKRRISGYYGTSLLAALLQIHSTVELTRDLGANDDKAPIVSASQAENDGINEYEIDESSANRPLLPISERPSSEEREDEEIEAIFSFIEESPAGSPEPTGGTSVSVHLDRFDDDVEMSDESDEEQDDENAASAAPAPAIAPLSLCPLPERETRVSEEGRSDCSREQANYLWAGLRGRERGMKWSCRETRPTSRSVCPMLWTRSKRAVVVRRCRLGVCRWKERPIVGVAAVGSWSPFAVFHVFCVRAFCLAFTLYIAFA